MAALAVAAVLLSVERATYVAIARWPDWFRALCARRRLGDPVAVVERLFYAFKAVQGGVFIGWWAAHGPLLPLAAPLGVRAVALAIIVVGQVLSAVVFYRLGRVGAFFGDRLGHRTAWCDGFPFSLIAHPQYVGAVLTIWGVFLLMRFPHDDWLLIPALETVYYAVGAVLEGTPPRRSGNSTRPPSFA